jgi:hypothetical protein
VTTDEEFDRRLQRLNSALAAMGELIRDMQEDEETAAVESASLNGQAIRVMRDVAAASRDVHTLLRRMPNEEQEKFWTKSRDPELLKRFFHVLNIPLR